jgi:hypothetical protein
MMVMGFIAIVGTFGLIYGLGTLYSTNFYSDRDLAITALQRSRSLSVGNTCLGSGCTDGRPHGVAVQSDKFIVFEGASYASRDTSVDETFSMNSGVTFTGATEIVFTQLSATSTGGTITLSDATGHTTAITVGKEGEIFWTK